MAKNKTFLRVVAPPTKGKAEPGFGRNGLSQWSRNMAHRTSVDGYTEGLRRDERANPKRSVAPALLLKTRDQLDDLTKKLPYLSGDRRAKAERDIDAKQNFIRKLEAEIAGSAP